MMSLGGKGAGMKGKAQFMAMMFQIMQQSANCKWCRKGECWDHAGPYGPMKGGGGSKRKVPYDSPVDAQNPASADEVETFLLLNPVDAEAEEKLRALDPKVQKLVINRGSLADARDATKCLLGRIRQVEQIASGTFPLKEGDWFCTMCGDHQFAKNTACRKCGNPKTEI